MTRLKIVSASDVGSIRREPFEEATFAAAAKIVADVKERGEEAVIQYAVKFGEIKENGKLYYSPDDMREAFCRLDERVKELLTRSTERVARFAAAQKNCLFNLDVAIEGGRAGHTVIPLESAGCYAPGGRFPLPSSALMTAVTAKAAGVKTVWVASPKPADVTLAAAYLAQADGFLAAGGAHAIAALAYGAGRVPPCASVAGPGSKWVTAAKLAVAGHVSIDMLAGPSEVVVLADETANPSIVAADLLAQAEHDPEALPILVSLDDKIIGEINAELEIQLAALPTYANAEAAVRSGFAVRVDSFDEAVKLCDKIAPEHLQLSIFKAKEKAAAFSNYGALFIGEKSAEVFGDYCAGPNHTLPTGGSARFAAGLSVFNFLRARTFLTLDDSPDAKRLAMDAELFGEIEGLAAHSRAAAKRFK